MIKYQCKKCEHEFSVEGSDTFVKTVMPTCPNCSSNEVEKVTKIDKD